MCNGSIRNNTHIKIIPLTERELEQFNRYRKLKISWLIKYHNNIHQNAVSISTQSFRLVLNLGIFDNSVNRNRYQNDNSIHKFLRESICIMVYYNVFVSTKNSKDHQDL